MGLSNEPDERHSEVRMSLSSEFSFLVICSDTSVKKRDILGAAANLFMADLLLTFTQDTARIGVPQYVKMADAVG